MKTLTPSSTELVALDHDMTKSSLTLVRDSLPLYPLFISVVCGLGHQRDFIHEKAENPRYLAVSWIFRFFMNKISLTLTHKPPI